MNKMRLLSACVATALLCVVSVSFAADTWHTSKIAKIYPLADGAFILMFENDAPACTNTGVPKYQTVRIGENSVSELGLKNMLSAAMFAAAAGFRVTVNFDDSVNTCPINRLRVLVEN